MIIGTAGHIDHGKTALVRALTGVDTDRLKEEKARGITIDLGFAYLPTRTGGVLGFVDVPGHEKFVHNMLAGASGIDFMLLVVAADDGPMPQTIEHLAIIDLLGVERGIVALTKADLADRARRDDVEAAIRQLLAPTRLAEADIVPVSVVTGEGIDGLRERLFAAADAFKRAADDRRFRLAIDRSFTPAGAGTVVTGTVLSGSVSLGDRVLLSPSGLAARVRAIHAQNRPTERGSCGERCALNLVGDGIRKDAIHRGDVALDPDMHTPTERIDATLRMLSSEAKPIGQWMPVRLHHAAAEVGARIVLLGDTPIYLPAARRAFNLCSSDRSRRSRAIASSCAIPRRSARSAAAVSSICGRPRASAARPSAWPSLMRVRSMSRSAHSTGCWIARPSMSIFPFLRATAH